MQIKDLAIGDGYVYLMEDGAKVKFYALCHNYESVLNGMGRTMFCRESPANLTLDKFTAAVQNGSPPHHISINILLGAEAIRKYRRVLQISFHYQQ